jgi:hypothetical protein
MAARYIGTSVNRRIGARVQGTSTFRLPGLSGFLAGPAEYVSVRLVNLLGVRVSARGVLDRAEHARRRSVGMTAVTDSALLGRLLEVPVGQPVADPVMWAETASQQAGVVARGDDGLIVTRLLEPVLTVHDVIVRAWRGREVLAVQQASLFAGFVARWVQVETEPRDAAVMEAKLCGVGMMGPGGLILAAEQPDPPVADGWAWLLGEKAYRRWLTERLRDRAWGTRARSTGAASVRPTG